MLDRREKERSSDLSPVSRDRACTYLWRPAVSLNANPRLAATAFIAAARLPQSSSLTLSHRDRRASERADFK